MEEIKIIKTASCESLSGRSTITYGIGCKDDKSIYIRLTENTGSGMFSKIWVSLAEITLLLSADDKPITSTTIRPLYSGSVNSAGFLLSVLREIGLIRNIDENSRGYVRTDPQNFTAEIETLLIPEEKSAKVKKPKVQP